MTVVSSDMNSKYDFSLKNWTDRMCNRVGIANRAVNLWDFTLRDLIIIVFAKIVFLTFVSSVDCITIRENYGCHSTVVGCRYCYFAITLYYTYLHNCMLYFRR